MDKAALLRMLKKTQPSEEEKRMRDLEQKLRDTKEALRVRDAELIKRQTLLRDAKRKGETVDADEEAAVEKENCFGEGKAVVERTRGQSGRRKGA